MTGKFPKNIYCNRNRYCVSLATYI